MLRYIIILLFLVVIEIPLVISNESLLASVLRQQLVNLGRCLVNVAIGIYLHFFCILNVTI